MKDIIIYRIMKLPTKKGRRPTCDRVSAVFHNPTWFPLFTNVLTARRGTLNP